MKSRGKKEKNEGKKGKNHRNNPGRQCRKGRVQGRNRETEGRDGKIPSISRRSWWRKPKKGATFRINAPENFQEIGKN
jgi:hypothetical protein